MHLLFIYFNLVIHQCKNGCRSNNNNNITHPLPLWWLNCDAAAVCRWYLNYCHCISLYVGNAYLPAIVCCAKQQQQVEMWQQAKKKKQGKKQGKITYQQCVCKLNVKCSQTCLYTHVYTYMYICTCMYVHTYVYVAHYCCHKIAAGAHERILNILHVARNVLKQSAAAENKNNCK